jgi:signal transduction histidine kinase
MGSKTRTWLLWSMGGLLSLTAATGAAALAVLARAHGEESALRARYQETTTLLERLRDATYASGALARDYLLDPDPALRRQLGEIEERTRRDAMRPEAAALRGEVITWWRLLDLMMEMAPKRRGAGVDAYFRQQLAQRRGAMLAIAESAGAALDREWRSGQTQIDGLYARFRWTLGGELLLVFAVGLALTVVTIRRLVRLEGETHRLSAQLLAAQEEERRSIARELHDEVGQALSGLLLETDPARVRARLEDAVDSVRRISLSLRPSMLDDLGLVAALEWQAREVANRSGMNVEVRAAEDAGELPEELRTCIFRVAQEALRNCARHAKATRVRVGLERAGRTIALSVVDDGKGFQPARTRGMGLLGMEERVAQLGGSLRVEAAPGIGTTLTVELPL